MKKTIIIFSLIGIVILTLIPILYDWSVDNKEVKLREKYEAQQKVCESNYDKMWKTIKQVANVSEEYRESFAEMYKTMMEGRYKENTLMKWVQEDNPDFSTELYADLNVAIEANRKQFDNEQKKLTSIKEQHDVLLQRKPSKWFINDGIEPIDHKIITSTKTNQVFESGKDDDTELFDKK